MDFEGEYCPSNNGVTIPYTLESTANLYKAFTGILSKAEVLDEVKQFIEDETSDRIHEES